MDNNQNVPVEESRQPQAATAQTKPGLTEGIWAIILAVLALGFFPPVFGLGAIY